VARALGVKRLVNPAADWRGAGRMEPRFGTALDRGNCAGSDLRFRWIGICRRGVLIGSALESLALVRFSRSILSPTYQLLPSRR